MTARAVQAAGDIVGPELVAASFAVEPRLSRESRGEMATFAGSAAFLSSFDAWRSSRATCLEEPFAPSFDAWRSSRATCLEEPVAPSFDAWRSSREPALSWASILRWASLSFSSSSSVSIPVAVVGKDRSRRRVEQTRRLWSDILPWAQPHRRARKQIIFRHGRVRIRVQGHQTAASNRNHAVAPGHLQAPALRHAKPPVGSASRCHADAPIVACLARGDGDLLVQVAVADTDVVLVVVLVIAAVFLDPGRRLHERAQLLARLAADAARG